MVKSISAIHSLYGVSMTAQEAKNLSKALLGVSAIGSIVGCEISANKAAEELKDTVDKSSPYLLDKNGEPIHRGTEFMTPYYDNPLYDPTLAKDVPNPISAIKSLSDNNPVMSEFLSKAAETEITQKVASEAASSAIEGLASTGADKLPIEEIVTSHGSSVFGEFISQALGKLGENLDITV